MGEVTVVRDVELVKVGSWDTLTMRWDVTRETIASMLAARDAGVLRKPVVKLGHVDERFNGQPSFGHIDNLRAADGGDTLVGDLVLPEWLAAALPMHYPDRSVEARLNMVDSAGRTWPAVLTGVALLGAAAPAIADLTSLQDLVAASTVRLRTSDRRSSLSPRTELVVAAARRRRRATVSAKHSPASTHTTTIAAARRRRATRKD